MGNYICIHSHYILAKDDVLSLTKDHKIKYKFKMALFKSEPTKSFYPWESAK